MVKKIFINLPVKDLNRSIAFFTHLGFTFNPDFTDDTAACMIVGENIFSMLITEKRFTEFTTKSICHAQSQAEVLASLQLESREEVDEMVDRALDHGAKINIPPQDHGYMYIRSFLDLDGHVWEMFYFTENK